MHLLLPLTYYTKCFLYCTILRGRAERKSKLDYNLFLYLPNVYFYYLCSFVKVVYKALFCTLSSAILIGRADGVWIPVHFSHCDCEFKEECCLNISHVIVIDEVTELVKVTKIVRRSVLLLLFYPAKYWGRINVSNIWLKSFSTFLTVFLLLIYESIFTSF